MLCIEITSMCNNIMQKRGMLMLWALLFLCFLWNSQALWITISPAGTKCVSEELHTNVVVLGEFAVITDNDHSQNATISIKVTSPYGNSFFHMENSKMGEFAFTSRESGNYLTCLWADPNDSIGDIIVNLDWKIGIAAKDWESVARKEKIEGVELELRKLEGSVESIHENLIYLRGREAEMRNVNEKTNSRVAWFSIMSLGICIAVSVLQLWHLKRYFHKKKLI